MAKPTIPAIQTRYKGHHFRSRLEARWAVFFDACGTKWEYEKEGYDLTGYEENIGGGDHKLGRYLPDFWLPDDEMWVEIKPELPSPHFHWTLPELQVWNLVMVTQAKAGLVIFGLPDADTKCSFVSNYGDGSPDVPCRSDSIYAFLPWVIEDDHFAAAKSARFEFGQSGAPK